MKSKFIEILQRRYPALGSEALEPLISENLLSPFKVEISSDLLRQAQNFVRTCFQIRESTAYRNLLRPHIPDPGNKSILMSYDFHVSAKGELKLIEINTNASFLALADVMYEAHGMLQPVRDFSLDEIGKNILQELQLFGRPTPTPKISIVDELPNQQRLYAEFLMYQQLFNFWGFSANIHDIHEVPSDTDLVYNRYTDFYLSEPKSKMLLDFFLTKKICFSPNPFEYFLLADKQRMIDLCDEDFLAQLSLTSEQSSILKKNLPSAQTLNSSVAEQIWAQRKNLFFKPKQSYGSKHTYKGASISRKAFDEISTSDFLAQEYIPADEKNFATQTGPQNFKYDLRFYAYKDRVQSGVARLYQGQVTNLRTPLGGFSPLEIK